MDPPSDRRSGGFLGVDDCVEEAEEVVDASDFEGLMNALVHANE
ncbi:MAG TPA: hypothetical protein VMI10_12225 [Terriglobales bacterium]|nr:hypothetical protein [Terriglobales bacterium]